MSWNYRFCKETITQTLPKQEPQQIVVYGIKEVYYDKGGAVNGFTEDWILGPSENKEDIHFTIDKIKDCMGESIIDLDSIK